VEKAFNSFSKIKIVLTDGYIERLTQKGSEKIYYTDIETISIKKTTHKNIREIKINSKDKQFYLNGLADMNDLYKALRICIGKDTKLIQKSEWIDFNSKYFYPILGI
jgi:hypothetical protein